MTDQHPLTDDMCLAIDDNPSIAYMRSWRSSMRTAADWQLEQVIDWLHNNLDENYIWADVFPPGINVESVIDDLKQAMRPQEDNS